MARPGIMLYFDILDPIRVLPDEDKGKLLIAMLEYGQSGVLPEFTGMLALAWGFIKPKIDKDDDSYENSKLQRKYAAFCKKRPKHLPKITFDEWLEMDEEQRQRSITEDNELQRPVDFVNDRYPTTATATATSTPTSTTTPTTTNTSTATSTAATVTTFADSDLLAAATAEKKLKFMNGELGKGVVVMSEFQVDVLLNKLGVEMFDHYVRKLADWIINNGATVKSHYSTILKWWTEDSSC